MEKDSQSTSSKSNKKKNKVGEDETTKKKTKKYNSGIKGKNEDEDLNDKSVDSIKELGKIKKGKENYNN